MRQALRHARVVGGAAVLALSTVVGCDLPTAESPTGSPEGQPAVLSTSTPGETATVASPTPTPTATPTGAPTPTAPTFTETGDWSQANGGLANTRARDSAITSETVQDLAPVWAFDLNGQGPYGAAAGAPIVAGDTVYVEDLGSNLYAVDLATGEQRWQYAGGPPTAGPVGPTYADGRVFIATGLGGVHAVDASTGEPIWAVALETDGFQPLAFEDTVFIGTGNFAHVGGHSGYAHALDAATGESRWSFQVVEEGFWGDPALNSGGGIWYPPGIDEDRGLAYFGTGNAGPYPGTIEYPNAESRPGPNLYTSSVVALDLEDGSLAWYHQAVERGLFDHDFQTSPILVDADVEGEERALLVGSGKLGRVIALRRDTNEVIWDTEVGVHENDDLEAIPLAETVKVFPGIFGGVETPMSVAGGRVFVPVVNLGTVHTATGHGAIDGSGALLSANNSTNLGEATGELVALDLATGEPLWRQELDSPLFGGATAVGDLVFTATYSGTIVAYRQDTGEEVWRHDTGGGINAWPAVQDDRILWPVGLGPQPQLIAFGLGGGTH
ncbi:MAG: PQQ-binding-like beta-propeller repeat protein [Dehalococcoidia bacterium]|nr:PQQ-binding-like beta-propeller repeat protein [Dehalococcoidia bacterium]